MDHALKKQLTTLALASSLLTLSETSLANGYNFTTIDVPYASSTSITGVLDNGEVYGSYNFNFGGTHGFIEKNGVYTTIDEPNSDSFFNYTDIRGISSNGDVYGNYFNGGNHGFKESKGIYTTLDAPNASGFQGTVITGARANGQTYGAYADANGTRHGFVENKGVFTTIDDPNASSGFNFSGIGLILFPGTGVTGITNQGVVFGDYTDSIGHAHGYIENHGVYTSIDDPNINTNDQGGLITFVSGTHLLGVLDNGDIYGSSLDSNGSTHGFIDHNGVYTTIAVPNLDPASFAYNTYITRELANGDVYGFYTDSNGVSHIFIEKNGIYSTIDLPIGSSSISLSGVLDDGKLFGTYGDNGSLGSSHGFVASPISSVPLPPNLHMLIAGLMVIGVSRLKSR